MLHKHYAKIALLLVFFTVLVAPKTLFLLILLLVLGSLSIFAQKRAELAIITVVFAFLFVNKLLFPDLPDAYLVLRTSAVLAFIFLNITLLMGPWAHFVSRLALYLKYRRQVGVTAFLLAFTHAYLVTTTLIYPATGNITDILTLPFTLFGLIGLYILTLLAVTSWNYFQGNRNLAFWTVLHGLSLAVYIVLLRFYFNYVLALFGVYWLLLNPYVATKLRTLFGVVKAVNGWKQLHLLVYAGYISVIFHIYTGILEYQPIWVQVLFWIQVALVVGSHLTGWLVKLTKNNVKSTTTNQNS